MSGTFTLKAPWSTEASVTGESAYGPLRESYNWGAALSAKKIKLEKIVKAEVATAAELNQAEACRDLGIFTEA